VLPSSTSVSEDLTKKLPWLALNMVCATWPAMRTQWAHYVAAPGALQRLQEDGMHALEAALPGLTERLAVMQQGGAFADEIARLQATGTSIITLGEGDYPQALRWIPEPPPVLYIRGTLRPEDSLAVAIVGSRKPSPMANWPPSA
jgi:DNA processing protein